MKNLIIFICFASVAMISCEMDNYDPPQETLKGTVVDVATGEPVLTEQTGRGIRIRLNELSWTETEVADNYDFYAMTDGTFQNTKLFEGHYNVRVDGPFIPLVRVDNDGDTIADDSKYIDIEGVTEIEFEVQPFLKVEWVGEPSISNGKITAQVRVTRAVSPADFRAKIEPMGNYSDDFLNITDVNLFVSQVPSFGWDNRDDRYTTFVNYGGDSFEAELGETISITTNGEIPAGRTVFIRAGARINYTTENIARFNYNESVRVDIPN